MKHDIFFNSMCTLVQIRISKETKKKRNEARFISYIPGIRKNFGTYIGRKGRFHDSKLK